MSYYPEGCDLPAFELATSGRIRDRGGDGGAFGIYAAINIEKSLATAHRLEALIDIEDASMDKAKHIGLAVAELERQTSAALAEAMTSPELGSTAALNDAVSYWRIANAKLTEALAALRCIERGKARLTVCGSEVVEFGR